MNKYTKISLVLVVYPFLLFAGLFIHFSGKTSTANAAEPKQNSTAKQCPVPSTQPKTDSCKKFADKATKQLEALEREGGGQTYLAAGVSAYSSYYLVCRDLERER